MCGGSSTGGSSEPRPKAVTTTTTTKAPTTTRKKTTTVKPTTRYVTTKRPTTTESLRTTSRPITTEVFPKFTTLAENPYNFITSEVQSDLGSNDQFLGSDTGVGLIAIFIAGTMCIAIPIVILVIIIWRKHSAKKSAKYGEHHQSEFDSRNGEEASNLSMDKGHEDGDNETVPPLYTQVNKEKKKKNKPGNTDTEPNDHHMRLNQQESARGPESATSADNNGAVSIEGAHTVSYSTELDSNEQRHYQLEDQRRLEDDGRNNLKIETNSKYVNERKKYENVDSPVVSPQESTYYNQEIFEPEIPSDQGDTYDQLDRLDRTIANETIIGENIYDT